MNLAESDSCACTIHSKSTFEQDTNWGSYCADAVWKQFNELNLEASSGNEALVLAGFVLREKNDQPRVIATGTGNKMLTGNNFSLEGITINDSHAEIVARRSLRGPLALSNYAKLKRANPLQPIHIATIYRSICPQGFDMRLCETLVGLVPLN